eukprot:scaffold21229_cov63-Phaeocystis_antarctica.AAC.3
MHAVSGAMQFSRGWASVVVRVAMLTEPVCTLVYRTGQLRVCVVLRGTLNQRRRSHNPRSQAAYCEHRSRAKSTRASLGDDQAPCRRPAARCMLAQHNCARVPEVA